VTAAQLAPAQAIAEGVAALEPRVDTLRTVEAPEGVELALRVAGPYPRAIAYAIDLLVRQLIYSGAGLLTALQGLGFGLFLIVVFVCEWFYPVLFEVLGGGATPGKRALGLKVVRDDGTPVGWSESLLRNLLLVADLFPLGGIALASSLASPDFKRLGDRVAGTVVIHVDDPARAPRLAPAEPAAPPVPLELEEQAALVEYSVRAPSWPRERAREVAEHLSELAGARGEDAERSLYGLAQWVEGAR
jgi:uncharacterized RDD family membrane protein YckC